MTFAPLGFWLDRWCAELPELSATVGRVAALARRNAEGTVEVVQELEVDSTQGVVEDPRGPAVFVARFAALSALSSEVAATASGDQVYLDLDLSREGLPENSALTIGSVILGVRKSVHAPDEEFRAAFGRAAARRVRRQNRIGGGGRRLACPVLQPGVIHVGDRVYAKAVGIRFQP